MKKFFKALSIEMILVFIITIFTPYLARADGELSPSLKTDSLGNYIVATVDDLNTLRNDIDKGIDYSGKNVELTQNIDISEAKSLNSFTTDNAFGGNFNGNFHTISGYSDAKSGLFSVVSKDGVISNVRIDAKVEIYNGENESYGLIANKAGGTIICCSSTGSITNVSNVIYEGGIVAENCTGSGNDLVKGCIRDCYSNIIIYNKSEDVDNAGLCGGICAESGKQLNNCYFYGRFEGIGVKDNIENAFWQPIVWNDTNLEASSKACIYDKDLFGDFSANFCGNAKGYTTEDMKNKNTYTTLGFDFDKIWKIDSSNQGYPYLNPENTKKSVTKVNVDVKITAEDKTYDTNVSVGENLKTKIKDIKLVPQDSKYADLISKYNVTAAYDGNVAFSAPTIGNVPVNIDSSKVKITYDPNNDYEFVIGKLLPSNAKLLDNGTAVPTEDKQKEQIENAKKAEDILYKKLGVGQGAVPKFTWSGNKTSKDGKDGGEEGTVELNDYVWEIFSSARSGYTVRDGFYDDWFKSVQTGLQKMKAEGITPQDVKMTEWDKLVLAITAIGYDPRDIEAYNLIDIISNQNYLSSSYQNFSTQYALLALDSYNYKIPDNGNRIDKQALIHKWAENVLRDKDDDDPIEVGNNVGDMWLMAFQPIAAYYGVKGYDDVKQAMDYAFNRCSNSQTYKGSFYGGYNDDYNNPWTNAQVYMTIGMAKGKVFDSKYIKNGNTMIDAALEKFDIKNGTTQYDSTIYEPAQICRGIDSLVRSYEGRNSIFDCTDVKDSTVLVNNAIEALPDSITSANKKEVEDAKKLYDELTNAKKASIKDSTKAKLDAAKKALDNPTPDVTAATVAAGITSVTSPLKNVTNLILPIVPSGYKIVIKSSDKPEVIGLDGKITPPDKATTVALVFTVINISDNTTADTASINVIVAAKDDTGIDKTIEISNLTQEKQFNLGNDAQITIQAANKSSEAKNVALIVGIYDNNGALVSYGASQQNINASSSVKLRVILKLPDEGNYTVKGFIWNGLEEMIPISYPIEIPVLNK